MRTKTEFYGGYEAWPKMKTDVANWESNGWSVRQVLQSNGTNWVVVFEKDENL